jgi:hypothetical protein
MRHRFHLLIILALIVAACGTSSTTDSSTEPPAVDTPEAVLLSYTLEPGSSYTYEVSLDQTFDIVTTGDSEAFGDEEIPGEMSVRMVGTSVFTHSIAEGPEPDTYSVSITGDFSDIEFSGTIDGEPVDPAEIPDLAELEPVDVTVVVDEQGNVISGEGGNLEDFMGTGGGLDALEGLAPGGDLGRFVGPPLSEGEVTVGDSWSETIEIPSFTGGESSGTTEITSTVTGTDSLDGVDVFVIDTAVSVSEISFDLAELLIGMFEAFLPEDASDEDLAELELMSEQLRFQFSMAPSLTNATTWFDAAGGVALKSDYVGDQSLVMDINVPDEETGDMIAFGLQMDISQTIGYRLVDSASA